MSLQTFAFTFFGLYMIMIFRYVAISGSLYWAFWKRPSPLGVRLQKSLPKAATIRAEIIWSVLSTIVYAVPGAFMIESWKNGQSLIYNEVSWSTAWYLPVSLFIYMFLHDTYFYWTHRLMHIPSIYKVMHQVHHNSRNPTPWAAFSFHYTEAVLGAVFIPVLVFLIPIHIGVLLFLLTLMSVCAAINHNGVEFLPRSWIKGFVGEHFITATHHNHHHKLFNCNYGLYFRFWDKWMKTDHFEPDPENL